MIQGLTMRSLFDFGMVERPAVELNAVRERRGQHLGDQEPPEGRQLRLLLAGAEEDAERFAEGVAAEVVGTGHLGRRSSHGGGAQRRDLHARSAQLSTEPVECQQRSALQLRIAPRVLEFAHAVAPGVVVV